MAKINAMKKNCKFGFCDGNGIVPAMESLDGHHSKGVITCECRAEQSRLEAYDVLIKAGNMSMYKHCQLATFEPRTPDQAQAFKDIDREPDSYYFMGPMGTGKTHLLAALINREISAGRPAALITVPQLIAAIGSSNKDDISELERLCYKIPYLGLDDLGKELVTGYMAAKVKGVLFRIIDHRNMLFKNKQGHTSFSSQYPRDPIFVNNPDDPDGPQIKGTDSLIDRMDGATVDRIREITLKVLISGESQRKGR